MVTIQQTVDIPANRRLSLDLPLPETVPSGRTSVLLVFETPAAAPAPAAGRDDALARILSHKFPTLEELKAEAARKAEERAAAIRATGVDPLVEHLDALKGAFEGVDGVAYQRSIRDEWPD